MTASSPRRGRRRWLIALGVVAVLAFLAWRAVESFADIDRYRPDVEALLAEAVGKPVSIGELDLAWRPIPCVSAIDVRVGEGDLAATAARVDLYPDVLALLSRRVDIARISLRDLVLTLPPDSGEIQRGWEEIDASLTAAFAEDPAAESLPSDWAVSVWSVAADDAQLRLGAEGAPLFSLDVTADGIDTGSLDLRLEADFPEVGAHGEGSFVIPLDEREAGGLRGHLDVRRLRPYRLFDLPERLRSSVEARLEIASEKWDSFQIALSGDFEPDEQGAVGGRFESHTSIDRDANATSVVHVTSDDFAIDANASWKDDALEIARFDAGPVSVRGRIRPDPERGGIDVALTGQVELADAWLHALGAPPSIRDTRGTLVVEEVTGHFPPQPDADPVVVRAHLVEGATRIVTESVEDALSELSLRITSRDGLVAIEGGGRSQQMGRVATNAEIDPAGRSAHGELSFDAGTVTTYIAKGEVRDRLEPFLRRTGETRIAFRLSPVPEREDTYTLRIDTGEETLPGHAVLTLHTDGESELLGDIHVQVAVSGQTVNELLARPARFSGDATLEGRRSVAERTFAIDVDLADMAVTTSGFIEKRPGEPLALHLTGTSDWKPRQIVVSSGAAKIPLDIVDGGLVARDLDIDLADWDHLLVDTARASGSVRGSFDGPASKADFQLTRVALHFTDGIGVDEIDGAVARDGDDWRVTDLRLRGARSDATLDASLSGGVLDGRLAGENLDLDFVEALVDEVNALRSSEPDDPEDGPTLVSGTLAIRLDRVGYGRSEAKAVTANVRVSDGDIAVRDLALETYEGRVSGTIEVDARDAAPSLLSLRIEFVDVTGRFLDDAFFDPRQDIRGRFTGKIGFDAPLHDDVKAMLAEANGTLETKGANGSFGKLGIATKLITVVRSSEALRAKLPSLQDEGLVFDTLAADFAMRNGKLEIALLDLDSHSYTLDASGHLDFRTETSKVPIEANMIKGLTGVVSWIPVAGRALEIVNVRLVATGSPYDLEVGIASFTDQLLGAGRAGAGAIINDASDALRILRGAVGMNRNGGDPTAVPPEPAPPVEAVVDETSTPPDEPVADAPEPTGEPVADASPPDESTPETPISADEAVSTPAASDETGTPASEPPSTTPPEGDTDGTGRSPEEAL